MHHSCLRDLLAGKLIAVVRGIPSGQIADLGAALVAGGIRCIEVTFDQTTPNHQETLAGIRALAADSRVLVGAGTVMSIEQVRQAAEAGGRYIISPHTDRAVIEESRRLGLVSIPGAFTPTEIAAAHGMGADIVKLFPISQLGPAYLKAVRAPLPHIPIAVVGGVIPDNLAEFLQAGAVMAGVGGNLVSKNLVAQARFDEITALARRYREAAGAS